MDCSIEANLYLNGTIQKGCIGITNGKITQIKKIVHADDHLCFGKKLLLPSATDIHVHFRDPGYTYKEDFRTGSIAAAYGGVTCIFDMPNTLPATTTRDALQEKHKVSQKKSVIDYGLYAALTDTNIENTEALLPLADGFKIYMAETSQQLKVSDETIQQALLHLKKFNALLLVHAEIASERNQEEDSSQTLHDHIRARPASNEETAIRKLLQWNQQIHSNIHICHLSSCEGLEVLQNPSPEITVGVTPHHLLYEVDKITEHMQRYKVNPPIRTALDRENLWYAMTHQRIDIIESDHAPHTLQEKEKEFSQAPSGVPGVETMYPLFLAEAQKNRISLSLVVDLLCTHPANRLGVSKGQLREGYDADFIVVDYKSIKQIRAEHLHSKCGWTPYEGKQAIFPSDVFLRGECVIENGELIGKTDHSQWVKG